MIGWQDMDQAALDDAYANAAYIDGAMEFPPRWAAEAAAFRACTHADLDVAYADTPGAALDLFYPDGAPQGLVVFVHGGYWYRFGKSDWSHFAEGALAHKHAVAIVGYPLAPSVRISEITRFVSSAIDAASARIPGPIRLTGHSAGGHLAARAVMPDAAPACAGRIATCVPISPLADLRPIVPQSMNADLRFDAVEAASESPVLGRPIDGPRITVHVGTDERPSFLWQAEALGTAWSVPVRRVRGAHHFDVIDTLRDPGSHVLADLLA
ncbi:alpha/beta hydrolase fold [Jannaschia faecimaris]|uniref:Alpha/beta hydrolase fold n=1 Tax=Jannaschia faecimaris TaxID=1244108 RepID=A0A1H3MM32_9RHOB|nr:alpha/beta hydrolase [Jannaschia faecimaris]SDY77620.1 alpha/beta hydrolase fold [Jannaschia faecimaris]